MNDGDFDIYLAHLARLLRLSRRQREDIRRELAAHVRDAVEDLVSRGDPRDKAIEQVLDDFGDAAELAARFGTLGRKRRWVMNSAVAAACIGLTLLAPGFFDAPAPQPTDSAAALGGVGRAGRTEAPAQTAPQDQEIRAKLRTRMDVDFNELPFDQALEFFTQSLGVNVHVQWQRLADAGIERDRTVSLKLRGVTIERALRMTLDEAGQDVNVDYEVQDGVLLVSTQEALQRRLIARVYDVRDLLAAIGGVRARAAGGGGADPAGASALPQGAAGRLGGMAGGGGGAASSAAADLEATPAESELTDLICEMVAPETWAGLADNGHARVRVFHGALVVLQTGAVHREIDELLANLRNALARAK